MRERGTPGPYGLRAKITKRLAMGDKLFAEQFKEVFAHPAAGEVGPPDEPCAQFPGMRLYPDYDAKCRERAEAFRQSVAVLFPEELSFDANGIEYLAALIEKNASDIVKRQKDVQVSDFARGLGYFFGECLRRELGGVFVPDARHGYAVVAGPNRIHPSAHVSLALAVPDLLRSEYAETLIGSQAWLAQPDMPESSSDADEVKAHIISRARTFQADFASRSGSAPPANLEGVIALEALINERRKKLAGRPWEKVKDEVMAMASFLGECFREEFGGEYGRDRESGFSLTVGDMVFFAVGWVMKFIEDRDESLVGKYEMLAAGRLGDSLGEFLKTPAKDGRYELVVTLYATSADALSCKVRGVLNSKMGPLIEDAEFGGHLRFRVRNAALSGEHNLADRLARFATQLNEASAPKGAMTRRGEPITVSFELVED